MVDEGAALDTIRATIGDARVPLGIDGVAGEASATIAGVLSESGTLVVYALMSGKPVTIAPFDLIAKRVVVKGFFLNHPDVELKIPSALRETAPLVASGVIRVPIAATYRLTGFREFRALDALHNHFLLNQSSLQHEPLAKATFRRLSSATFLTRSSSKLLGLEPARIPPGPERHVRQGGLCVGSFADA